MVAPLRLVNEAPANGANSVYVKIPGQANIGALNVNAFRHAKVAYYSCAQLPGNAS